jgi:threonine dehydrogenase-like Zn-dependent dehydrogenase/predicted NBD/HSP70 family sugar kinase
MTEPVICVDMGGTTTRVGAYQAGTLMPGVVRFATKESGGRDGHLDQIATAVARFHEAYGGREVGLAVGATVDTAGVVRNASMLWGRAETGFDLVGALAARLPWAAVTALNDIAAAAYRYQGMGRFAIVTISTGVAVKVFAGGLVLDDEQLGGEVGHVPVDVPEAIAALGVPRCECGNGGDLCSYTSGPAAVRLAGMLAVHDAPQWRESKLFVLCEGTASRITTRLIADAAAAGDGFALRLLAIATRPLAAHLLHMSALLGLRRFVVMGGFALGVGEPWFAALRANLRALLPGGGWFTGWSPSDVDSLVQPSLDGDDSLAGMGRYLVARKAETRELHKPVGARLVTLRRRSLACGREQFVGRVHYAGVCGTDLQMLRGERGNEPGVLGHECVAEIVEVGRDVRGLAVGDVFGVNPNHPYDEHDKIGHNQSGVFREHVVWDRHLAARGQIVALPSSRPEWVLLEPLACTVRSLRLRPTGESTQPSPPETTQPGLGNVLVLGAGVSGLLHVLLARRWGASRVLLANRNLSRMEEAVARNVLPLADCLQLASPSTVDNQVGLVDTAIVTVSGGTGPALVESLWPVLADGATVHLFGGFLPDSVIRLPDGSVVPSQPIRWGQPHPVALPGGRACLLVGSRGASAADFGTAISAGIDLAPLVSHTVSLEAAPGVLASLTETGRVDGELPLRVVIDMSLAGKQIHRTATGRAG